MRLIWFIGCVWEICKSTFKCGFGFSLRRHSWSSKHRVCSHVIALFLLWWMLSEKVQLEVINKYLTSIFLVTFKNDWKGRKLGFIDKVAAAWATPLNLRECLSWSTPWMMLLISGWGRCLVSSLRRHLEEQSESRKGSGVRLGCLRLTSRLLPGHLILSIYGKSDVLAPLSLGVCECV